MLRQRCWILGAVVLAACSWLAAQEEDISPISNPEKLPAGKIQEEWVYASRTSAVIYWQTENRARSYVEYGETNELGQKTPLSGISAVSKNPFWTHFHRITGLKLNAKCFYRMAVVGTDGSETRSETKSLETKTALGELLIPERVPGPPYVLNKKGARYVLTRDLEFPSGGLDIREAGITLDLDGHTLGYNAEPVPAPKEWSERAYRGNDFGIKVSARGAVTILNGTIRQGKGNSAGTEVGIGCNPVYSREASVEIAGVEAVWSGKDVSGLFLHWAGGNHVHHCVFDDQGTGVTNRHQAISTIDGNGWGDYDHNLVKSTRQQALMGALKATHNEVYIDSHATNSFGIVATPKAGKPVEVAFNRVIGVGEHPVGLAAFGAYAPGSAWHGNRVEVKCTRLGEEYGYTGSACFRTTWGADNLDVFKNTFTAYADLRGGKSVKARTLWVGLPDFKPKDATAEIKDARGVFRENTIIARGPEGARAGAICVVCLNKSPNLIFLGNTVVSTWGNVLLSDDYGDADGYPKFVENSFRRAGTCKDYFTIRQEYGGRPATAVFLGNQYVRGTREDACKLLDKGELVFQNAIDILVKDPKGSPVEGARVLIKDAAGAEVFSDATPGGRAEAMLVSRPGPTLAIVRPADPAARGFIDAEALAAGTARAILTRCVVTAAGAAKKGPYTLSVTKPGFSPATQSIDPEAAEPITVILKAE